MDLETRVAVLEERLDTHIEQQAALMDRMDKLADKLDHLAVEIRGTALSLKWVVPMMIAVVSGAGWVLERVIK